MSLRSPAKGRLGMLGLGVAWGTRRLYAVRLPNARPETAIRSRRFSGIPQALKPSYQPDAYRLI
jgi:hypothetical protein